ncbi:899_t:CDS:2 [Paraglomus brasilianum]|uniref:899_t:CDS:1 n=1 Tax=Paraglomus brasilianum TaxID=144538 RepID=A0A9N8VZH2_9GLOM|nr:899_t:CDS:2 [Paraglomus brasilianum]
MTEPQQTSSSSSAFPPLPSSFVSFDPSEEADKQEANDIRDQSADAGYDGLTSHHYLQSGIDRGFRGNWRGPSTRGRGNNRGRSSFQRGGYGRRGGYEQRGGGYEQRGGGYGQRGGGYEQRGGGYGQRGRAIYQQDRTDTSKRRRITNDIQFQPETSASAAGKSQTSEENINPKLYYKKSMLEDPWAKLM